MPGDNQPKYKVNRTDFIRKASTIATTLISGLALFIPTCLVLIQIFDQRNQLENQFLYFSILILVCSLSIPYFLERKLTEYDILTQENIWVIHDPNGDYCASARKFTILPNIPLDHFNCYIDPDEIVTSINIDKLKGSDIHPIEDKDKKKITVPFSGVQPSDGNTITFTLNSKRSKTKNTDNKYLSHFICDNTSLFKEEIKFRYTNSSYLNLSAIIDRKIRKSNIFFSRDVHGSIDCNIKKSRFWSINWEEKKMLPNSEFKINWRWVRKGSKND